MGDCANQRQRFEFRLLFLHTEIWEVIRDCLVELRGFEPLTSAVRLQRSPI